VQAARLSCSNHTGRPRTQWHARRSASRAADGGRRAACMLRLLTTATSSPVTGHVTATLIISLIHIAPAAKPMTLATTWAHVLRPLLSPQRPRAPHAQLCLAMLSLALRHLSRHLACALALAASVNAHVCVCLCTNAPVLIGLHGAHRAILPLASRLLASRQAMGAATLGAI